MVERPIDQRSVLLVLASTYPRWANDHEPGFVHELARRLASRYRVVALVPAAPGALASEMLDGVEVIRYRYAPRRMQTLVNDGGIVTNLRRDPWKLLLVPGFVLAQLWGAWQLTRKNRVSVIHAHWLLPQGLIAAAVRRWTKRAPPFLVTSHGADLYALRGSVLGALKRLVCRSAGAVTVVSHSMRDELARLGVDPAKVSVCPMGVDLTDTFSPDPAVVRRNHELLFVGRLVEKKGLRFLIDALPAVIAQYPQVTLTIAGFGPEKDELVRRVASLGLGGKVAFLGPVPQKQLPWLLRRATVLVAPFVEAASGDQEGLGLVMVEALGCGCPVLTTRIPAVKEVFSGSWPTYCATPGSSESLAAEILRLLGNRQQAWAEARQMAPGLHMRFDWAEVAATYERALDHVIGARVQSPGDDA